MELKRGENDLTYVAFVDSVDNASFCTLTLHSVCRLSLMFLLFPVTD